MSIILIVIQLLSTLVPALAKVIAAINESHMGGVKEYDKLLVIADQAIREVASMEIIGDTEIERNFARYAQATYKTLDAAEAVGMVVKDHQVHQAVSDAFTAWKMANAKGSDS